MAKKVSEDFARALASWVRAKRLWNVSPEAFRAYVMMTAYAAGEWSDGYIDAFNAKKDCLTTPEQLAELVKAGLLTEEGEGYRLRSHDGQPWETSQYTQAERDEDRKRFVELGKKGGLAKAAKSTPSGLPPPRPTPRPTTSAVEPWPEAQLAFEGCYDTFKGVAREGRAKAWAAFAEKIPDKAASDQLFEQIKVLNDDINDTWGGFGFVRFLDEYTTYVSRKPKPQSNVVIGHFKVTDQHDLNHYGPQGEQKDF